MKLTVPELRVKGVSPSRLLAACLLTGFGVTLIWAVQADEPEQVTRIGEAMAELMAVQTVEPVLQRDLIQLGVLANRVVALPEVLGVSIHDAANEPLVVSGDLRTERVFPAQIAHDNRTIGLVRVHLNPEGLHSGIPFGRVLLSLIWMSIAPALVLFGGGMRRFGRSRETTGTSGDPSAIETTAEIVALPVPEVWHVVVINLFNQLSLTPEKCARELNHARRLATRVARRNAAEIVDLPGTGLMLAFGSTGNGDRPFHALRAAFVLCELLRQADTLGRYRISVHTLTRPGGELPDEHQDEVHDAAVLSALAGDFGIVVSEVFHDQLDLEERLVSERLTHPLLDELASLGGGARSARSLAGAHAALIDDEVSDLSDQEDDRSTRRESTF